LGALAQTPEEGRKGEREDRNERGGVGKKREEGMDGRRKENGRARTMRDKICPPPTKFWIRS